MEVNKSANNRESSMKIIIIGNCGSGKSTLAKKIAAKLSYPLLQLDSLWHQTDYSPKAKKWFVEKQTSFMEQKNWIIEGNYRSTIDLRLKQADLIIWLKINKFKAVWRVIKRSILFRLNKKTRPEMPARFKEHFDREYWEFLKFVVSYDEKQMSELILANSTKQSHLLIIRGRKGKGQLMNYLLKKET
ncbi:DNA topology modulation protein [Liquorilactobacillus mali]|uniref:DNA topology modulation protein n=2 Tax=Liquorilactobacillus mali TaxID=1618 RepID=A0A0R2FNV6_9LACO|nr:DNA topology modulation protein [Liquorilactobacillus mali]